MSAFHSRKSQFSITLLALALVALLPAGDATAQNCAQQSSILNCCDAAVLIDVVPCIQCEELNCCGETVPSQSS